MQLAPHITLPPPPPPTHTHTHKHTVRVFVGTATAADGNTVGFYISVATKKAFQAFGKLSGIYSDVSRLLGSCSRVVELLDVMDELEALEDLHQARSCVHNHDNGAIKKHDEGDDDAIEMEGVDIVTPTGVCLAKDLSVAVTAGHSLMVTGFNGSGKTSFFRCLAGLWPAPRGSVRLPSTGLYLVPQKCYAVTGSIADQVTYVTASGSAPRFACHVRGCEYV
jgi:ABC-type uncharacterized transport system fused permease/ATPase subunit